MSGRSLYKTLRLQWRVTALEMRTAETEARACFRAGEHFSAVCINRDDQSLSHQAQWRSDALRQRRGINVDTHGQEGEELTEKDYHRIADVTLGEIMVKLEALIEDTPGIADSDLEYSQGVLTLNLGSHGTYVINKQGPNKQIWMSSPVSGPVRYDLSEGKWVYKHDGHIFQERLAEELSDITGKQEIDLEQAPQVAKGFVGYGADPT